MSSVSVSTPPVTPPSAALPAAPAARPDQAGRLLRVSPALPAARRAVEQMFDRCSLRTRYQRFHAPVKAIPARYLAEAVSGHPFHHALIAWHQDPPGPLDAAGDPAPRAVALASCRLVAEGAAELGLLVEDDWQRAGVGRRLLGDLVAHADRSGVRVLEAQLMAEQAWIATLLRPYGPCRLRSAWDGIINVTVRLPRP
jgi:GNAT superfamily N-acetyltransferase